ncbi:hypothetical protein [Herbaspirillum aquaticum]|uniref:hypothetical protein n=1 Tax=Herbaspirillum aquaticum TaxID=568783 RepID=UPI0024DE3DC4|nr:hypothetical protein [Herbaspirillum aquaticum]
MKKLITAVMLASALVVSGVAMAHGAKARHGGVAQSANDISFELVAKDGKATIYLEDHDDEIPSEGVSGKLTVLNGSDKTEVPLESAGGNKLVSKGELKFAKGAKAIASITFKDKSTVNVRFSLK